MNPAARELLQLRDVHTPPAPPSWPPAPGWWLLGLLLLALLGWVAFRVTRYWLRRRRRRLILQALERVAAGFDPEHPSRFLAELSALLRRVAIGRYSRRRVAPLTGRAWLAFLDETGGDGAFSNGVGQIIEAGPYRELEELDPKPLLELARHWIEKNSTK